MQVRLYKDVRMDELKPGMEVYDVDKHRIRIITSIHLAASKDEDIYTVSFADKKKEVVLKTTEYPGEHGWGYPTKHYYQEKLKQTYIDYIYETVSTIVSQELRNSETAKKKHWWRRNG